MKRPVAVDSLDNGQHVWSNFRLPRKRRKRRARNKNQNGLPLNESRTNGFRTGTWSEEERLRFLLGLRLFGEGRWKEIGVVLQTRSNIQIKSHAQKIIERKKAGEPIFEELEQAEARGEAPQAFPPPSAHMSHSQQDTATARVRTNTFIGTPPLGTPHASQIRAVSPDSVMWLHTHQPSRLEFEPCRAPSPPMTTEMVRGPRDCALQFVPAQLPSPLNTHAFDETTPTPTEIDAAIGLFELHMFLRFKNRERL